MLPASVSAAIRLSPWKKHPCQGLHMPHAKGEDATIPRSHLPHELEAEVSRKAALLCQARSCSSAGGWRVRIWEVTQPQAGRG